MYNIRAAGIEIAAKEQEIEELKKSQQSLRKIMIRYPDDEEFHSEYKELLEKMEALNAEVAILNHEDKIPVITNFSEELQNDSVMTNSILKATGYRITINGTEATTEYGALQHYEFVRRSQNYGCYIIRTYCTPEPYEELGKIDRTSWNYYESFLAISRDGLLAEAPTDQELINTLKARKSQNGIV